MAINIKINPIEPAYRQVEKSLRRLIQTDKTRAMARLPTTAELAVEWGRVSRNKAQKALGGKDMQTLHDKGRRILT